LTIKRTQTADRLHDLAASKQTITKHLDDVKCATYTREITDKIYTTRMRANAQPDGRPAEHRWRPLFSAAKFS